MPDRDAFFTIFYVLRTGMPWKALPRCLGAGSTVHDRFQKWRKAGVFGVNSRNGKNRTIRVQELDFGHRGVST